MDNAQSFRQSPALSVVDGTANLDPVKVTFREPDSNELSDGGCRNALAGVVLPEPVTDGSGAVRLVYAVEPGNAT